MAAATIWLLLTLGFFASSAAALQEPWIHYDESGEIAIRLHFFWTRTSPHCQAARPFVESLAANAYELLCTSGFPLIYKRILTLEALPAGTYYLYLALYNLVYVTPLLVIVGIVTWTLGARKLDERSGRTLKLLSGMMMLSLGVVLILAPHRLSDPLFAVLIPVAAVAMTMLVVLMERTARSRPRPRHGESDGSPPTKQV